MTTLEVIKQGYLQKKSRHIGAWRQRWTVFATDTKEENVYRLCTFTSRDGSHEQKPTEYIRIDVNTEIKVTSWRGNGFYVENNRLNEKFQFEASSADMRDEWVQSLLSRTDVGSLSGTLFENTNYCHKITQNGSIQRHRQKKRKRNSRAQRRNEEEKLYYNYNRANTVPPTVYTNDSIQSHIEKMRKCQNGTTTTKGFIINKNNKFRDISHSQKIMNWIEMEILLKTGNNTYYEMIIMNEFDNLEIMQKITNQNLSEIGIEDMEHRMLIMQIIGKIPLLVAQS